MSEPTRPFRLPDGSWGAVVWQEPQRGQELVVETRSGEFQTRVIDIVGWVVTTSGRGHEIQGELMPCMTLGCSGQWSYTPGLTSAAHPRVCARCLAGAPEPG